MTETIKKINLKRYTADYSKSELGTDRDKLINQNMLRYFMSSGLKKSILDT